MIAISLFFIIEVIKAVNIENRLAFVHVTLERVLLSFWLNGNKLRLFEINLVIFPNRKIHTLRLHIP